MKSLRERICAAIELYDEWDDDGGIVLARDMGAEINSYTGPKAWESGAQHVVPPD